MKTQLTTKLIIDGLEAQFLGLTDLRNIAIKEGEDTCGIDSLINETIKEIEVLQQFNLQYTFKMCSEFESRYFAYITAKSTFVN